MAKELAGSLQLIGYIKPDEVMDESAYSTYVNALKASLKTTLPEYMVPSVLQVITQWPLTPNGKVDKKALPEPDSSVLQGAYVAPESATEQALAAIWSELLTIDAAHISRTANFFELGGHSLLSIRLIAAIRQQLSIELPVQAVFDTASLMALAEAVDAAQGNTIHAPLVAVTRSEEGEPVSFSQQRLWFIDKLQGGSPEYNMPMALTVHGQLDIDLINRVITEIVSRHEVLRSVYLEVDGQAQQVIKEMSDVSVTVMEEDVCHLQGEAQQHAVRALVEQEFVTPFDLAEDVMMRVNYIHTSSDSGVLLFNMHHIASDGWSMDVLSQEFFALYDAFSAGKASPLPALAIQYADYAHWQREHLVGAELDKQLLYWEQQLEDVPGVHGLPLSYPRPAIKQHIGAVVTGGLPAEVSKQLQVVAKQHKLTPFMLLHGALSLLLARHSNSSDIVVGTPVANRTQSELTPLIGFFVNTLVLRAETEHETLAEYFQHIREVHIGAQSNQDVPFEQLVDRLKVPRGGAHSPLFQIMLTTSTDYGLSAAEEVSSLPGLALEGYDSGTVAAKFDLDINLSMSDEGVGLTWTYDISVFDEQMVTRLNTHLCRLLTSLAEVGEETAAPHSLAMLSSAEEHHLVTELNDTGADYPKGACIHELFEQQAQDNPDSVAVVFEDTHLTYGELNSRANQLAHYLVEKQGVKPDTLVGICVERSLEMVIGILGILKAGGAYVPLDPSYPQERL
ncbi:non-ribosomal peptide synthetase, partial [Pseudoalteromonas citrea]